MAYTPQVRTKSDLLALTESVITSNNNREITGSILNHLLQDFIESIFNAASSSSSVSVGASIFVSKTGDDATGVRGDFSKHFVTIEAAVGVASSGDTIVVFPGDYTLSTGEVACSDMNFYFHQGVNLKCDDGYLKGNNINIYCLGYIYRTVLNTMDDAGPIWLSGGVNKIFLEKVETASYAAVLVQGTNTECYLKVNECVNQLLTPAASGGKYYVSVEKMYSKYYNISYTGGCGGNFTNGGNQVVNFYVRNYKNTGGYFAIDHNKFTELNFIIDFAEELYFNLSGNPSGPFRAYCKQVINTTEDVSMFNFSTPSGSSISPVNEIRGRFISVGKVIENNLICTLVFDGEIILSNWSLNKIAVQWGGSWIVPGVLKLKGEIYGQVLLYMDSAASPTPAVFTKDLKIVCDSSITHSIDNTGGSGSVEMIVMNTFANKSVSSSLTQKVSTVTVDSNVK